MLDVVDRTNKSLCLDAVADVAEAAVHSGHGHHDQVVPEPESEASKKLDGGRLHFSLVIGQCDEIESIFEY